MRVVWLCPYPVTLIPGAPLGRAPAGEHPSTWIRTALQALRRYAPAVDVQVITESPWLIRDISCVVDGVSIHAVRSGSVIPGTCRGWPTWMPIDQWTGFSASVRLLAARTQALKPDLVHAHGTERAYGLAALASGRPVVLSLQGLLNEIHRDARDAYRVRARRLERNCVQATRYFVAKSAFARSFIERMQPDATIFDIENPVPDAFFSVSSDPGSRNRMLFVGSLLPEKGIVDLLEAMTLLPDAVLTVVGSGPTPFVAALREHAATAGLDRRIEWAGSLPQADVVAQLDRCGLLVLPSHMETSPNVIAEAMAAGRPVVATAVGGIPGMVEDGVTGVCVPPRDASTLARALGGLLVDSALRTRLGSRAREVARHRFDPAVAAWRLVAAYEAVVRTSRSASNPRDTSAK